MHAIVLAGGLGTRLRSVVPDLPKPMAPVRGRPFLSFVLDRLIAAGFSEAILAVGYRHEVIVAHFGQGYRGLALRYSVENVPLGTGGAIQAAWRLAPSADVVVLNGDTFLEVDYSAMLDAHRTADAELTMAVREVADAGRYGALVLEAGRVRGFQEKGRHGPGCINAGVYVLSPRLRARFPNRETFSFEQDVLVAEVAALRPLAFPTTGRFIDIGIPADYERANTVLA
jgi:D-glycero-alpha-D-manno-heptose 1-phosphate guanylyltransferase